MTAEERVTTNIQHLTHLRHVHILNQKLHDAIEAANAFGAIPTGTGLIVHTVRTDRALAELITDVGQEYELAQAELEATQPDPSEDMENCFDSFVDGCLTDLEDWSDSMGNASTVTVTVSEEGPNGTRYFSTTVADGFVEATTREIPA